MIPACVHPVMQELGLIGALALIMLPVLLVHLVSAAGWPHGCPLLSPSLGCQLGLPLCRTALLLPCPSGLCRPAHPAHAG